MTTRFHPRAGIGSSSAGGLPVIDVVADHGAAVDGITDDTAAWQAAINAAAAAGGGRIVSSISGVSIIAGSLQDTGGANAQLLLPSRHVLDDEQISIVIEGAVPPPAGISVIGDTPVPDNHLVLKSTLASGSGGALLGAKGPAGSYADFTYLMLQLRNVAFRMPANPTHTALDLRRVACVDMDNVVVDAGSYWVQGLAEPSTATSYALRTPKVTNGAYTRLSGVSAVGFYNGLELAEHTVGNQLTVMGCKRGFVFAQATHASKIERMLAQHCQKNVVFTASHYVDIGQLAIEHAASGWWVTTADVDDPSDYGHGSIVWLSCVAGGLQDHSFVVNGGAHLHTSEVGAAPGGAAGITVQDENGTVATGVTQIDFQGANVAATAGTGEVVVTVTGAGSSYREVLMESGTSPPVPLESSDGGDWLYGEAS